MTKFKCEKCGKEEEAETAPQCCDASMQEVKEEQTAKEEEKKEGQTE